MKLGIPSAIGQSETRVALVPEVLAKLKKLTIDVVVERGAGNAAGFPDSTFESAGATLVDSTAAVCEQSNLIVSIRPPTPDLLDRMRTDTVLIAMCNPLVRHDLVKDLASRGLTAFALELMPRITRAQAMDVLSSMSSLAGYKAVLLAANELVRIFPMMMTAAGTITPAKVLVLGAGVAGLQAIATARRLGAVVEAFDVRPVVKEQVESLGAKFVVVDAPQEDAQDKGGYAKEMSAAYQQRQREVIAQHVKDNDVVISTALIPGKPAPRLITSDMVPHMRPGSVIVDLAAEAGGNCELTCPGETVVKHGVTILAPVNLPATVPYHASQMFARNVTSFLADIVKNGELVMNMDNECIRDTLITREGQIVSPRLREIMGLGAPALQPA
ncbi:MAG: NAD(P) transhydrogenase subunit alpha [Phycisphaerae bacterium]|nr:MAG: Re/Si-specific NAD(P)(+) transhydrogenase subunit alpha [Planctomycetia bacterium]GJQ25754.1 MAG: NAD(P) transhydrogenase subunit alpha [Phycisphaerae bacterium]